MACLFPFYVDGQPVCCGRCPKCLVQKVDEWTFRINKQLEVSRNCTWWTLTYDNFSLEITDNNFATLSKRHCQLFFKKLRKYNKQLERQRNLPHVPIKYYLAGEYGSKNHRPHYHVILMNAFPEVVQKAWSDEFSIPRGDAWMDDRPINTSSIGYTVGYQNKQKTAGYHSRDDRTKEFSLKSKGLGLNYLTDNIVNYHLSDPLKSFVILNGKRVNLPRYYREKLNAKMSPERLVEYNEIRSEFLDASVRKLAKQRFDEHIRLFGSADGFIRSESLARRQAVINFQNRQKKRKDL